MTRPQTPDASLDRAVRFSTGTRDGLAPGLHSLEMPLAELLLYQQTAVFMEGRHWLWPRLPCEIPNGTHYSPTGKAHEREVQIRHAPVAEAIKDLRPQVQKACEA